MDYNPGVVLNLKFATIVDGVPVTLAGSPAVKVYKNDSTTESAAGVSLVVDFDGVTGMHNVNIDTSADGTFYSAGDDFSVVVTAGTVDGFSLVGFVIDRFTLNKASAISKLPAALVGGRMDSSVGAMSNDVLTAAALAGDAVTEIQSGLSTLDAAGVRGAVGLASANLDTQLDALPTANENADALLNRNVMGGSSTGRKVREALSFLRNKWTLSGTTLTVFDVDDTTPLWTAVISTNPAAEPVTGSDPG